MHTIPSKCIKLCIMRLNLCSTCMYCHNTLSCTPELLPYIHHNLETPILCTKRRVLGKKPWNQGVLLVHSRSWSRGGGGGGDSETTTMHCLLFHSGSAKSMVQKRRGQKK